MRYPFKPVPAMPSTPDVSIGVTLQKIEPTGTGSGTSGAGDTDVGLYWAMYPTSTDDTVLTFVRSSYTSGDAASTTPPNCFLVQSEWSLDQGRALVGAYIRNAPVDAVIEWNISEPVVTTAPNPATVTYDGASGPIDINVWGIPSFHVTAAGHRASFRFTADPAWVAQDWYTTFTVTATVNGVPMRTLTLNVAYSNVGAPLPEE